MEGALVLIGWILVVVGWLANHWLSEMRDRRKEVRSQVDGLQKVFEEIRESAINFHLFASHSAEKADGLLMAIRKIEGMTLRIRLLDEASVAFHIKKIRQAITLNNFEASNFSPQRYQGPLITDIQLAIEDIAAVLEGAYSRVYPHKFPYYSSR